MRRSRRCCALVIVTAIRGGPVASGAAAVSSAWHSTACHRVDTRPESQDSGGHATESADFPGRCRAEALWRKSSGDCGSGVGGLRVAEDTQRGAGGPLSGAASPNHAPSVHGSQVADVWDHRRLVRHPCGAARAALLLQSAGPVPDIAGAYLPAPAPRVSRTRSVWEAGFLADGTKLQLEKGWNSRP